MQKKNGDDNNLIGISESRVKLIKMLRVEEVEYQLKVVSVVGSAGVGKTALVKEVYHELRGQFEFHAFVRVSRKPDMRRLLRAVLAQAEKRHQPSFEAAPVQNLIDSIKECLQDKRYLFCSMYSTVWSFSISQLLG